MKEELRLKKHRNENREAKTKSTNAILNRYQSRIIQNKYDDRYCYLLE